MLHSHCDPVQYRNSTAPFRKSDLHRIANDHWNPITMLSSTRVRHTTTQNRTLPSPHHGVVCVVVCQLWAWCVCICKLWACTHPLSFGWLSCVVSTNCWVVWLCQLWAYTHPSVVSCVLLVLWLCQLWAWCVWIVSCEHVHIHMLWVVYW